MWMGRMWPAYAAIPLFFGVLMVAMSFVVASSSGRRGVIFVELLHIRRQQCAGGAGCLFAAVQARGTSVVGAGAVGEGARTGMAVWLSAGGGVLRHRLRTFACVGRGEGDGGALATGKAGGRVAFLPAGGAV